MNAKFAKLEQYFERRRQRVAEKFANPLGRKTDAALFSGKRMDEDEQVEYRAAGTAVDSDLRQ